ncbi:MAG TPA: DNA gyrase inhibitor YacG [Steroidobacteraceae bacterium]|nr:DNA gyrase inhibitor YacG [Steroidobacteraceae bacterium]
MSTVPCPTCQRPVEWSEASPFRPFCSERCKLIDLGAWITEKHVIPGDEEPASTIDNDLGPIPPARH